MIIGKGERVLGVLDRPNFIVALGSGETISAGSRNSELGALGKHDTIVVGDGHELIVGGPDGKIIAKGAGYDLLVDTHPNATIELEDPDDEVIVSGRHDHVMCSGDAFGEEISDTSSDTVSKSCLKDHNQVKQDALMFAHAARIAPAPAAHAAAVSGDGSDNNPYTAPCDNPPNEPPGSAASCTVSFPARTLSGFWANEFVPAYTCPEVCVYRHELPLAGQSQLCPGGHLASQRRGGPGTESDRRRDPVCEVDPVLLQLPLLRNRDAHGGIERHELDPRLSLLSRHCTNDALHSGYGG